jgi:large subunit ribosomal protein L21
VVAKGHGKAAELDRANAGTVILTLHLRKRRKPIYAVVETGGKQYRVAPGQVIKVERLTAEPGSKVELDKVLLVASDDAVVLGKPHVKGAKVVAEALGEVREDKVTVFHFKPKVRIRRKRGHRQFHTRLAIKEIHPGRGHKLEVHHSGT